MYEIKKMGKNPLEDIWDEKKIGLTSVNWLEDISEKKKVIMKSFD